MGLLILLHQALNSLLVLLHYQKPILQLHLLCGWIVFGEKVTIFITIGGLVTLLGVYLVNKAFKAIPPPEQPETEGM